MVQEFKLRASRIKLGDRYGICLILVLSLQHNCLSERQLQNGSHSNTSLASNGSHRELAPLNNLSSNSLDLLKNQALTSSSIKKSTRRRSIHKRRRRNKPREESKTLSPFDLSLSDGPMKEHNIDSLSSQYDDNDYLEDTLLDSFEEPPTTGDQIRVASHELRKKNEIENIVRSQLDFGASNWVTLKPEEYPVGPTFNESIQGLDWPTYLANYSKSYLEYPASVAGVLSSVNLFYPNHNYKFDNNSSNPFRHYVSSAKYFDPIKDDNGYLSTSDSVTASSEESNRYDQLPSATESHFGTVIVSTPEPALNKNHTAFNPMQYKYTARNLPPKTGNNVTSRPRWYNPNLDLSRLVPRTHNSEASHLLRQPIGHILNTSELVKQEPQAKPELESKLRMTEGRVLQKIEPANKLMESIHRLEDSHIKSGQANGTNPIGNETSEEKFQDQVRSYQLRPTVISNGPPQPPWLLRNHFSSQSSGSSTKPKTFDSHLEVTRHLKESEQPTGHSNITSGAPDDSPSARPSDTLLWDSSSDYAGDPKSSSPRFTTVIIPTIQPKIFTPAPPGILLPSSTELPVPNHVKSNSAASMRAIGLRLGRRPSHHHHHHSHIHNIRPAVISLPSRPKFRDYEGLVAAAAAAAAATAAATATSNNHQATYRHGQQVLARHPWLGGIAGLELPSAYRYRLNIGPPASHVGPVFVRHPPVTIPIGGTLSSMNSPQHQLNKPPLQSIQATITSTYHRSLLGHILDTANRAVKQVAGNTVGLLSLHPPPALAESLFPNGRVYAAKNNRGNNPGIRDLFEGSHEADMSDGAPTNTDLYMDSLRLDEKQMNPIGLKVVSHPTIPLKSLSAPDSAEDVNSDFGGLKEQVIFAPLSENSNLLYPILSSQIEPNPVASLIEETDDNSFSPMAQTSSQNYYQAPLWTPEMETNNKRIPLNKHYNKSSLSLSRPHYSQQIYPQHRRRPIKTILVEEKKAVPTNNSFPGNLKEQPMRYALAHYIGETDPAVMYSNQKGSPAQSGKKLVYEILDDNNNANSQHHEEFGQASPIDFIPINDSEALQSSVNVNKMPHKNQPLGQVYANLNGQTFVLSNVDKKNFISGGPIELPDTQDPESAAILATSASMSDDYRHGSSDSKAQQHLIHFTTTGSLYPHTDPLHQAIQAAATSIKPHLTAASDLINYHKLRLINHYLQYHMNDGSEFGPPSNSARLASSGGPRAHLLLHYWPIVLALLPIMIIVSIMVQLVLAAPLVLFAMTTLTAARFVGAIFGPLFGREDLGNGDLIGAATKSGAESLTGSFQQTPNQLTNSTSIGSTARISNSNFIQSIIKMHNNSNFGPSKAPKAFPVLKVTDGPTMTPKTSSQKRKRKKRHLGQQHRYRQPADSSFLKDLESYIDSLEL